MKQLYRLNDGQVAVVEKTATGMKIVCPDGRTIFVKDTP